METYMHVIIARARETFGHDVVAFLPDQQNKNKLKAYSNVQNLNMDENEMAVAIWAFEHQKEVGFGTDTLPNAKAHYVPLMTARGKVGVLAIFKKDAKDELTIAQERLLKAYSDLAAVAIESILLNEEAHNFTGHRKAANSAAEFGFPRPANAAGVNHRRPGQPARRGE
jgi:two-component system sensor histidine kinase KdpD